jgi:hypothetical protein
VFTFLIFIVNIHCTIAGCGGYADDNIGAISTTGHGESIMKFCLAHYILVLMEQGRMCIYLLTVCPPPLKAGGNTHKIVWVKLLLDGR